MSNRTVLRFATTTGRRHLTHRILALACTACAIPLIVFVTGCETDTDSLPATTTVDHEIEAPAPADSLQIPDSDITPPQEPSVTQQASDLLGKAKTTGSKTVRGARKWAQDTFNGAAGATGQTAEDSLKWANETFESLKSQGLTTADSTSEWLNQDWNNIDSWQYKVVSIGPVSDEVMTDKLNELGKSGWECFHTEIGPSTRMFFKKPNTSYLRHMPFSDMIKLAPLLNQAR